MMYKMKFVSFSIYSIIAGEIDSARLSLLKYCYYARHERVTISRKYRHDIRTV